MFLKILKKLNIYLQGSCSKRTSHSFISNVLISRSIRKEFGVSTIGYMPLVSAKTRFCFFSPYNNNGNRSHSLGIPLKFEYVFHLNSYLLSSVWFLYSWTQCPTTQWNHIEMFLLIFRSTLQMNELWHKSDKKKNVYLDFKWMCRLYCENFCFQ